MDVLKSENLAGQELKDTLVTLTGIPEPLMHQELDEILAASGQDTSGLTLDDLRAAMLAYLESIQEEMVASGQAE